jgi:predicted Zn-dependent protease
MAARLAIAVVAVLAIAWLGINLRGYALSERGERLAATANATPAQVREAEKDLEDARFLNPDTRPLLAEGALLAAQGGSRAPEGLALLERAVRREPDNLVAWGVLAEATRRLDPERSREARRRVRELSPSLAPE